MNETKKGPGYLETIVLAMLAALAVVWGYDHYLAQKIAVFDLKGYLREQQELLRSGAISEEQFKTRLDQVEKNLNGSREIILLKEVVIRNGRELPIK